jgi:peptide/nickel transport system substrate-binding protein
MMHLRIALAALVACALCSCSSPVPSTTSTLVFAGPGVEPDTLNPLLTQEDDVEDFALLYAATLFRIDDRDRLIPEDATVLPTKANGGISPDGRTITYHLRHGVRWQDGAPFTSADVAFSWRAVMNPDNNVSPRVGYDQIESVTTPDRWTAILHLKRPYAPIISQFGNYLQYPILPAHLLATYPTINDAPYNALPVGTGPYRVVEWARGDHITLQANPRYWRGPPAVKLLVFRFLPNPNTAAAQLRTHEIGAWFNADPNLYPVLQHEPVTIETHPMNDIHLLVLNLRDPILRDVRVREAIEAALNRPLIVRAVVHGLGIPIDGDQPTFSWAFTQPRDAVHYDPRRAAQLLDAAGWRLGPGGLRFKNGVELALELSGTQDVTAWQQVAALVQDGLRRAGIEVTVKTFPAGLYFGAAAAGGILRGGKYQIGYDARLLGIDPNDLEYYGCDQFAPAGQNDVFWCDPKADRAMHDALSTYDEATRKRDYAIVQDEMAREVPAIPLWEVVRADAFSARIENFSPSPSGATFWNAGDWRIEP